jgi:hypothetical protein
LFIDFRQIHKETPVAGSPVSLEQGGTHGSGFNRLALLTGMSITTCCLTPTALDVLADIRRFVFAFRLDSYKLVVSTCTPRGLKSPVSGVKLAGLTPRFANDNVTFALRLFRYLLGRDRTLLRVFYVGVEGVNPPGKSASRTKRPVQVALTR